MSDRQVPYAKKPCAECPWRRDTKPGQFSPDRYEALRNTSGSRGAEAGLSAPLFACHKTAEGKEIACAGWLAVVGQEHLGVRYGIVAGWLPSEVLDTQPDWPELFDSYDEMADTQGVT